MVSLDQKGLHELEAKCTQESSPRCQVLCPFNVDVRGMLKAVGSGRLREARKLLQRTMPMPSIFGRICDHPCEGGCLRADLGGSLAVGSVENWLVSRTGFQMGGLPIPPKKFTMAVIGLGPAGLSCAADLAGKGYRVTCYHTGEPRDALLRLFPRLGDCWDEEHGPHEDWDRLAPKVAFRQVDSLDAALIGEAAKSHDAVFIDAGVCGEAPERSACDPVSFLWKDNICAGGWNAATPTGDTFCSPSRAGGEGHEAALSMVRIVTKVSLTASRERDERSPYTPLEGIGAVPRVIPANGSSFTDEEAKKEASRCLECQCLICQKACVYMQKYKGYPRVFARRITNNLTIAQGIHEGNDLINACALCGQCEEFCPGHFSMADVCLLAREEQVRKNFMPESAFEFAMEDMDSASGEACHLLLPGVKSGSPKYVFFPGCQLSGCRPEQVSAVYDFLNGHLGGGTGIYLSCCGIPARWAGEKARFAAHVDKMKAELRELGNPVVVTACSTCLNVFRDFFPEYTSTSLWEVLDGMQLPSGGGKEHAADLPDSLVCQDPCTARRNESWQKSVRSLAAKCGVKVTEPLLTGRLTACCGYGGNQWCSDPELSDMMAEDRAKGLGGPALASCIMCRERMASTGLPIWHLLDILPFGQAKPGAGASPATGLSQRRANRAKLRRMMLKELRGESVPEPQPAARVVYSTEMLAKLEAKHILQEDVEATLAYGKSSGSYFVDEESGHHLTSWRPRKVTFWVEYTEQEDGSFLVYDAWCHRMIVPGAGGVKASSAVADRQEK